MENPIELLLFRNDKKLFVRNDEKLRKIQLIIEILLLSN